MLVFLFFFFFCRFIGDRFEPCKCIDVSASVVLCATPLIILSLSSYIGCNLWSPYKGLLCLWNWSSSVAATLLLSVFIHCHCTTAHHLSPWPKLCFKFFLSNIKHIMTLTLHTCTVSTHNIECMSHTVSESSLFESSGCLFCSFSASHFWSSLGM